MAIGWLARALGWVEEVVVDVRATELVFHGSRESARAIAEVVRGPNPRPDGLRGDPATEPVRPTDDLYPRLVDLLRSGLNDCMGDRALMLKPHVVVRGASSFDPHLPGYGFHVLRMATFEAGARTVRFEEDPPATPPGGYQEKQSAQQVLQSWRERA